MRMGAGWRGQILGRSVGLALLCAMGASGQTTNSWNIGSSGYWESPANWSLGLPPSSNQAIVQVANGAASKTVTFDYYTSTNSPATMTISNLWLSAPAGFVNTLYLNASSGRTFRVLNDATLTNGGLMRLLHSSAQVDDDIYMDGKVELRTGGTLACTNGQLHLGYLASRSTDTPTVTITQGLLLAQYMVIGEMPSTSGRMLISDGTNVFESLLMGSGAGSSGTVSMASGLLSGSYMAVGSDGSGSLAISNGTLRANQIDVAYGTGARGAVTLAGGTTYVSNTMRVGYGNVGDVTVAGGSLVVNGELLLGYEEGRLNVNSGQVQSAAMTVWGTDSRLSMAGGTVNVSSNLAVSRRAGVEVNGGRLSASNATFLVGNNGGGWIATSNGTVEAGPVFVGYTNNSDGAWTLAGGTNVVRGNFMVGRATTSTGEVWVTGGLLSATNGQFTLGERGQAEMTVTGGTVNLRGVTIGHQSGARGDLTVAGGHVGISSNLYVGYFGGSTGRVLVTGGTLALSETRQSVIGFSGPGTMILSDGMVTAGDLSVGDAGGGGVMMISGGTNRVSGRLWIGSNNNGTGQVQVTGGLLCVTNPATTLQVGAHRYGRLILDGSGQVLANELSVGVASNALGILSIGGSATAITSRATIGSLAGSTGQVSVTSGLLSVRDSELQIGGRGYGSLILSGSGVVEDQSTIYLGFSATGRGDAVVLGGALLATNLWGTSALDIRRGTLVQNAGTVWADRLYATNLAGLVSLSGGALRIGSETRVSNGMSFTVGNGSSAATMILGNGAHSFADGLIVTNSGLLQLEGGTLRGTIRNEGTVQGVSGSTRIRDDLAGGGVFVVNTGAGVGLWGDSTIASLGNAGTVSVQSVVAMIGPVTNSGVIVVGSGGAGVLDFGGIGVPSRGSIVAESAGVLRLGADPACLVTNRGMLQLSVGSLMLSSGLVNEANLNLSGGQALSAMSSFANPGTAFLAGGAALNAQRLERNTHAGTLFLGGGAQFASQTSYTNTGAISLSQGFVGGAGTVLNTGLIEGSGAVNAPLVNRAGGTIRAAGGLLSLSGASFQNQAGAFLGATVDSTLRIDRHLANDGTINPQGGTIDFGAHTLTNRGTATGYGTYSAGLILNEGRAIFQGGTLNVQGFYLNTAGHTTEVRYASATFHGMATNAAGGVFKNTGGQVSFLGGLYNNGSYVSDPATNWFLDTLTLGDEGTLAGGEGDVFQVEGDLVSLNPEGLLLSGAALSFGLGEHDLVLAGETAVGWLSVADGGSLEIGGANLYIGGLDVELDQLVTAHTLFYDTGRNPALDGQTYALAGGGWAMPIPEPSSVLLLAMATAGLAWLRRRVRG